jgi:hypothetical protein
MLTPCKQVDKTPEKDKQTAGSQVELLPFLAHMTVGANIVGIADGS